MNIRILSASLLFHFTVWFLAVTHLSHSQIQLATGLSRSSDTLVFQNDGESGDFVFCFLGQIISQVNLYDIEKHGSNTSLNWW